MPNKRNGEWQTHDLFETVQHLHMTWITAETDIVDLMVVKCADGRWYACNDGSDICSDVLFEPCADEFEEPIFFNSLEHLKRVICRLVSEQLGVDFRSSIRTLLMMVQN
ncbi:hypothetical protein [Vibrio sp. 10N.239.312.D08]|uniref:hypothetical protein n=1 Tax=Vibrio sp. 10N.239.312.D08 TaxID=3229978 RepID=UPI0035539A3B